MISQFLKLRALTQLQSALNPFYNFVVVSGCSCKNWPITVEHSPHIWLWLINSYTYNHLYYFITLTAISFLDPIVAPMYFNFKRSLKGQLSGSLFKARKRGRESFESRFKIKVTLMQPGYFYDTVRTAAQRYINRCDVHTDVQQPMADRLASERSCGRDIDARDAVRREEAI